MEIDTEVVQLLANNAPQDEDLVWSQSQPIGVNMVDHFKSFLNQLNKAKQKIYDRTKRYMPNYVIIASDVLNILNFIESFQATSLNEVNGPYYAGTVQNLKVFVSPAMASGTYVVGVNGKDMAASAAVYAPYMPVVPTQLLEYADGGNSQGFSTLYDLKLLNKDLLVAGRITA